MRSKYGNSKYKDIHIKGRDMRIFDDGAIYNLKLNKEQKQYLSNSGYLYIVLKQNGRSNSIFSHRVVAEAFIPEKTGCDLVNHLNGVKTDNRVDNLEWCTYSHNLKHAYKTELHKGKSKSYFQFNLDGVLLKKFNTCKDVQSFLETKDISGVRKCACDDIITYKGYIWEYTDEISNRKKDKIKIIIQENDKGEEIKRFYTLSEASKDLNLCNDHICKILNRKISSHKLKLRYEKRIKI